MDVIANCAATHNWTLQSQTSLLQGLISHPECLRERVADELPTDARNMNAHLEWSTPAKIRYEACGITLAAVICPYHNIYTRF
jgi:hypothetical protein